MARQGLSRVLCGWRGRALGVLLGAAAAGVLLALPAPARADEKSAQQKADEAKDQARIDKSRAEWEAEREKNRYVPGTYSPEAARAYESLGFDVGALLPMGESGWDPGLGLSIGAGAHGSQFRCEFSLLRWTRQDAGESLSKWRVPLFFGWRGSTFTQYVWWQAGGVIGFEQEDYLPAVGPKADNGSAFYGLAAGLGAGVPLGDFYLSLNWLIHYNRRIMGDDTDAAGAAFMDQTPIYYGINISLGYQSH